MKPPFDYRVKSAAYYDEHAAELCANTVTLDMNDLYAPFLRTVPPGGRILDAGCGSGRDSLAFLKRGFDVVPIDASTEMVRTAKELTGLDVQQVAPSTSWTSTPSSTASGRVRRSCMSPAGV